MDKEIKVGDVVRSHDFEHLRETEGNDACYIEGKVEDIGRFYEWQTCDCYKIRCSKKIFGGNVIEKHEDYYFPPVNGTPTWMGGETNNVVKL